MIVIVLDNIISAIGLKWTSNVTVMTTIIRLYLGWVSADTVALVVNVSQLLLQVELDPVVKADDSAPSSGLSYKHMFKPRGVWPGQQENNVVRVYWTKCCQYKRYYG